MGSGIYSLGTGAMFAAQAMLDTTAHNISNVNTPGYSRQRVELATEDGLFTGAGFFGRGVRLTTVSRATNEVLTKEANNNTAASSADATRLNKLTQLEKALPLGEAGLGYSATQFLNAFVDVSNQPLDMSARQVVLARAQEWVSRVHTADQQLTQLQNGVVSDLTLNVAQVNNLSQQIAEVNQSIATFKGSGHTPNDLLDRRDKMVNDLNKLVQVKTVEADDGSLSVFLGGGQLLVLSNKAQTLSVVRDPVDSSLGRVALQTPNASNPSLPNNRILDASQLTGGAIKGLLSFQDVDLAATRQDLEAFVSQFAAAVDGAQVAGRTMTGSVGSPIFAGGPYSASTIAVSLTDPAGIAAAEGPPSPFSASDNTNARNMLGLRDQSIITLDNLPPSSLTDAYSQMIGNLGVLVQNGRTAAGISSTLENNSKQMLSGETGVNLDEEASRLIQFQQSYQAAAKVLQVAQTVFDTLLNLSR
ncbi:flagellar hook-associated protein FlgK [Aquabacterium sp.]|uniref:flagellar hook-associated protein FlgK n=1 Tax=Aquabacterium sp. TaxID=1872578 RepID=UPI0026165C6D|nr:flagellar hook-associated protein FlgK [Aquabacterium sp.]MDD2975657.1 flagellar hook-associated protein FlgK [Aquabacterium sp.]